ncbi:MAG: integrase arm-type DNA-binding domain-containing protein [Burkholderia sp.]
MPTPSAAGKVPFTEKTIDALRRLPFEQKPVGVDEAGRLITEPMDDDVAYYFIRDASTPGFALRRYRTGVQTWYAERKLAGRVCRFKCGDYRTTSLGQARKTAGLALAKMQQGIDPNHERQDNEKKTATRDVAKRLTFGLMLTRDAERRSAEKAAEGKADTANTARDRRNTVAVVMKQPLWSKPVVDVTADDLATLIAAVRKKHKDATALKVWRYSRAAYGRLSSSEAAPVHPFDEFLKSHAALPKPKRAQRYLATDDEKGVAWLRFIAAQRNPETAVTTGPPWTRAVMADAIITTLCLGFRKMEALAAKVVDINFEKRWFRITEERAKDKRVHYVPLCPGLEALLRERIARNAQPRGRDVERAKRGVPIPVSDHVFPTERRTAVTGHIVAVQSLLDLASEHSGTYVTLHDLRRTFGGEMYSLIVGGDTSGRADTRLVKQALNHVDEQASEITLSYVNVEARINVLRPMAEAHERKIFGLCGIPIPGATPAVAADVLDQIKARAASDPAALDQLRAWLDTLQP